MKRYDGFTLIELLVTLVLVVIVSGVMYALYKAQNQTTITQGYVADMQQTLRASADILTREIRMAGYDPKETGNYEITEATVTSMKFTADTCEDGGEPNATTQEVHDEKCTETFVVGLYGVAGGIGKIRRTDGGAAIAENVEQFELCYFTGGDTCETSVTNLNSIDGVLLSILVRSAREDSSYKNTTTYTSGSGEEWKAPGDSYRRRLIVKRIQLRNMGL